MTIPQVSAGQPVAQVGHTGNHVKGQQKSFISLTPTQTEAQLETKSRLDATIGKLEAYKAELNGANVGKIRKDELKAKIARLEHVYANTTAEIKPDGSVKFTFKDQVNAADFREAYGLKEGTLRKYLRARHNSYIKTYDDKQENPLTILYDEQGNKASEYTNDGKNEEYFYDHPNSRLEYMDGYALISKRGGGIFNQGKEIPQYDGMSLGPKDNIGLIEQSRFKKP